MQQETTSDEFEEWRVYLNELHLEFSPTNYYLAQIALETRRSYVSKPNKYKLKEFLLDFTVKGAPKQTVEKNEEKISKSKAAWGTAVFGIAGTKLPKNKPPSSKKKK